MMKRDDTPVDKPIVWLHGEIKTPPFTPAARTEAGVLLRRLQRGELLEMPQSRPMPSIGTNCHELRVRSAEQNWRIVYRIDADAIIVLEVFAKKTESTPQSVIATCKRRIKLYDENSSNGR